MFNDGVSLADIAAVTGNNRNNDGMWGDGAWWIVILLIFGWGNGFADGETTAGAIMETAADMQPQQLLRRIFREDLIIQRLSAS